MIDKVKSTVEFFEENVHSLRNFDPAVIELVRVYVVSLLQKLERFVSRLTIFFLWQRLDSKTPWPLKTSQMLLGVLQAIRDQTGNDNDIRHSARTSIDDVLNQLNLTDYEHVIAVMPSLLISDNTSSVSRQLSYASSAPGPSKAEKVKPSSVAKPTVDKKPSLRDLGISIKRTVKQGIQLIKGRDSAAGVTERWKTLYISEIFDEVYKLEPLIEKSQVGNTIGEARRDARGYQKKKDLKGEEIVHITETEWILMYTQEESPNAKRNRANYLNRVALGLCFCNMPIDIEGTKCSACKEKERVKMRKRNDDSKPAWNDYCKQQLFQSTFGRMKPFVHRKPDINYILREQGGGVDDESHERNRAAGVHHLQGRRETPAIQHITPISRNS